MPDPPKAGADPGATASALLVPVPVRDPSAPDVPPPNVPRSAPEKASTVTATVRLEKVQGEVVVWGEAGAVPAKAGRTLESKAGLETLGAQSSAMVRYPDETLAELIGDTKVESFVRPGLRDPAPGLQGLSLARGRVEASISKQPSDRTMVFRTPQAEVQVLGTRLSLSVLPECTILEVSEGKVRLTRLDDGASIEVPAGFGALAGPGIPLLALAIRSRDGRSAPFRTELALRRGVDYLLRRQDYGILKQRKDELVLLACLQAGLSEEDPRVQELLRKMLDAPLEKTYLVALQAVILEELDRVKYQPRIAQCAQFLVDNMCRNGQWDYGTPSLFAETLPGLPPSARSPGPAATKTREGDAAQAPPLHPPSRAIRKIVVLKKREGPAKGDNSNAQYAALGLRAANDAGILLPKDVLVLARKWWIDSQQPETPDREPGAAGWSYGAKDTFHSYGSMTAGAAASLALYDYVLDGGWKADKTLQRGLDWMARHFTVSENPGPAQSHAFGGENRYYYYYAMARLGTYLGTEVFGAQEWYAKGSVAILGAQLPDGSWKENDSVCDTCFAILFLRRAARPLQPEADLRPSPRK
ncbi:MAG TPA: FecR domain-containing protein [Planctomycetota bacterium]|nr:FecR domain-containing protein [Planctomycetota bacterium]